MCSCLTAAQVELVEEAFPASLEFYELLSDEQNRAPWLGLALVGGRADHIYLAQVTSNSGLVADGDVVRFYDGSKLLKTATTSGGIAQFSTAALAAGNNTLSKHSILAIRR